MPQRTYNYTLYTTYTLYFIIKISGVVKNSDIPTIINLTSELPEPKLLRYKTDRAK